MKPLSSCTVRDACHDAADAIVTHNDAYEVAETVVERLRARAGDELLCSIFVRENDRLWVVAQRGYGMLPDGLAMNAGVMGRAATSGSAQYAADVSVDPDFVAGGDGVVAEVAAPIVHEGRVIGILNIESRRPLLPDVTPAFEELAAALEPVIAQAAVADGCHISSLTRVVAQAASIDEPEALAELACRGLGRIFDVERVDLVGRSRELLGSWRSPETSLEAVTPDEASRLERLVDRGALCQIIELDGGAVWVPLRVRGRKLGVVIGRSSTPVHYARARAEAATLLGTHIASLLDATEVLSRERAVSRADGLTGLLNRRGFEERVSQELERAERLRRPMAVAVFDCDHFVHVNNARGFAAGDDALRTVGGFIDGAKRSWDVAGRIGGDSFGVILPEVDALLAGAVAERLRTNISSELAAVGLDVTLSMGIASYPDDAGTAADVLRVASDAMREAKRRGRNRTLTAFDLEPQLADEAGPVLLGSFLKLTEALDAGYLFDHAHSKIVAHCAHLVAIELGLPPEEAELVRVAGLLHDIGKAGLPESILRKPAALTPREWDEVKRHPVIGAHMLERLRNAEIQTWIRSHHERIDGAGYPDGLAGDAIPLPARILAVADSYEAMTSRRPYRQPMEVDEALAELKRCAGSQFDPDVVEAFARVLQSKSLHIVAA